MRLAASLANTAAQARQRRHEAAALRRQAVRRAAAYVLDSARRLGDVKLLLLNVQPMLERGFASGRLNAEAREHMHKTAEEDAAAAQALVSEAQLSCESLALAMFGHPAELITRIALERGCFGIVMGTRGLGDWVNVFLGSTAYTVVQESALPVTLVRQLQAPPCLRGWTIAVQA